MRNEPVVVTIGRIIPSMRLHAETCHAQGLDASFWGAP